MSKRSIDEVNVENSDDDLYDTTSTETPAAKKAKIDASVEEPKKQESESEEEYTDDSDDDVVFNFGNNSNSISSNKVIKGALSSDELKLKEGDSGELLTGEKKDDEKEIEVSSDEEVSGNNNFLIEDESIPFFVTSKTGKPIDITYDTEFEGVNMDELDPNFLKEKPWRSSRAKVDHYFNYGFNEATWIEYLHRQTRFNSKYNGAKLLYQLMLLQNQGKLEQQQQSIPEVVKLKNLIKFQQKQQQRDPPLPTVQPIINAQGTIINPNAVNNNNNDIPGVNSSSGAPMFPFAPFNMMQMGNNRK
ncbi:hypothetical protein QEN19_003136 [Hanseniaspora menglaensis]